MSDSERMSAQTVTATPRRPYHWNDKAPRPELFYGKEHEIDIEFPSSEEALKVLEEISKEGEKHLMYEEHNEALWKYLYSKRICTKYNIVGKVSWQTYDNIADTAMRLLKKSETSYTNVLRKYVFENCKQIVEQQDIEQDFRVKAYYRRAECSILVTRLMSRQRVSCRGSYATFQYDSHISHYCICAIEAYINCHQLEVRNSTPDMSYLAEAVTHVVEWGKQRKHLQLIQEPLKSVCDSSILIKLLQVLLMSTSSMKTKHSAMELLLTTAFLEHKDRAKPYLEIDKEKAVSLLKDTIELCSCRRHLYLDRDDEGSLFDNLFKLFKEQDIPFEVYKSSTSNGVVQETLWNYYLHKYNDRQRQLLRHSRCLNPNHRTQLLLHTLKQKRHKDAVVVLESGDIEPEKINLLETTCINELLELDDTRFLESLLKCKVVPNCSTKKQKSYISQLITRWKKTRPTPKKKQKIVAVMISLLKYGGDAEDLCEFYGGRKTTAIHVATELCLVTGNTDLLSTVVSNFKQSSTSHAQILDHNNETPIYILSDDRFLSLSEQLIYTTCDILINSAGISLENRNVYDKTVVDTLPPKDLRRTVIQKFQVDPKDVQQVQKVCSTDVAEIPTPSQPDEEPKDDDIDQNGDSVEVMLTKRFNAVMEKDDSYFTTPESSTINDTATSHSMKDSHLTNKKQSKRDVGRPLEQNKEPSLPQPDQPFDEEHDIDFSEFDGLNWEVRCSDKVKRFLKNSRYPFILRKKAAQKIQKIASGNWNWNIKKRVSKIVELYEARFTPACRIIWGLKLLFSPRMTEQLNSMLQRNPKEHDNEQTPVKSEMIVITAIVLDHDEIHENVEVAEKSMTFDTSGIEEMFVPLTVCKQEKHGKQRFPKHFIPRQHMDMKEVSEAARRINCDFKDFEDRVVERNESCTKFYSLSTQRILSLLYGQYDRRDYPIEPSDEEYSIIAIPDNQAILLLGRSGTGKTTCCLCRIWNKFNEYWSMPDRIEIPGIPVYSTKKRAEATQAIKDELSSTEPLNVTEESEHHSSATATTKCSNESTLHTPSCNITFPNEDITCESTSIDADTLANSATINFHDQNPSGNDPADVDSQSNDQNFCCEEPTCVSLDPETCDEATECASSKTNCSGEQFEHLHQVFIAKNFIFCQQMRELFHDFIAGDSSIRTEHISHEDNDLPSSLSEINDLSYPLFLPARKFFLLLDQSLGDGKEFFEKIDSSEYYHDDEETLEDLLDFKMSDSESEDEEEQVAAAHTPETQKLTRGEKKHFTEVTASYFTNKLWPTLIKKHIDSKTDSLLVWTEIQSFIKGSFEALNSPNGYISESEYMEIGAKRAPFFAGDRKHVYAVFKEYQSTKHKTVSPRYDECDFIFSLYKRLNSLPADKCLPWSIHRLYVDEVQDFTQAELTVLLRCCRDPTGFFLTGDTAQSIVRGISFRFEDLKSIFQDMKSKFHNVQVPKLHCLTINHRSHSGVTDLASSVTDLLKEYFPYSFDHNNVPNDRSKFRGIQPIFLCSHDESSLALLLSENKQKNSTIEFGAHQVVVVRNKEAKQNLPNFIKDSAISLSIEESKGLEFDDVLIYNFFSDLEAHDSEVWRAAITYLRNHPDMLRGEQLKHHHPLKFNPTYHKSLSQELKLLYTVITRAKRNLWFYESGAEEKYLPMVSYWVVRNVIVKVDSYETIPRSFLNTTRSTEDDWKQQGDVFSQKRLWLQASQCYRNANRPLLERKTKALFHRSEAQRGQKGTEQAEQYTQAALLFLQCDEIDHDVSFLCDAAMCLYRAQRYEEAAKLFERLQKLKELFVVYKEQKDTKQCVKIKVKMRDYRGAIKYLLSIKKFDAAVKKAVQFVNQQLLDLHESPFRELTDIAHTSAQRCIEKKKYENLCEVLTLLPSLSQRVNFLKQAQLFTEAHQELVNGKRYEAAFRLCRAQGMWREAIQLAKEQDTTTVMDSLVLQAATAEIVVHGKLSQQEITAQLQNLATSKDLGAKAHALLLLARSCLHNNNTSFKYGKQALEVYNKIKGNLKIGDFETFNLFIAYQEQHLISPLEFAEMAVQKSMDVKTAVKILESTDTSSLFSQLRHVLHFYGLEKLGKVFCIPRNQDLWVKSLHKCKPKSSSTSENDSDGMLQLDPSTTVVKICSHFKVFAINWLSHAKEIVCDKLDEFPFHKQLQDNPYLVHSFRSWPQDLDYPMEYFCACNVGLLLCGVGKTCFDVKQIMRSIIKLFSPLSLLYLPLKMEHLRSLKDSTPSIYACIEEVVRNVISTAKSDLEKWNGNITNTSQWLKVWRLMGVFGMGHDKLETVLADMEKIVAGIIPVPTKKKPLPLDYIDGPTHYFSIWLRSCKIIRQEGDVLYAIQELALPCFVKTIAKRSSLHIDVGDLVNIFSIFSLAMFSLLAAQQRRTTTFFLPETFGRMMQTFDELNCQKPMDKTLLEACTLTFYNRLFNIQIVYDCLWDMLSILLGVFCKQFAVLNYSIVKRFYTEALHCLVLTLTILGNMAFIISKEQVFTYQAQVLQQLKPLVEQTGTGPEYKSLQEAYISFAKCTGTQDIFRTIVQLLSHAGFAIVELKAISHPSQKMQFSYTNCSPDSVPQRQLKALTDDFTLESNVKKLAKHLAQSDRSKPRPETTIPQDPITVPHLDSNSVVLQTNAQASSGPQIAGESVETVVQEPTHEGDFNEWSDFDFFGVDVTDSEYNDKCHVCSEYNASLKDLEAHKATSDHMQNQQFFEDFDSEFKWQYQSCETALQEKIQLSSKISHISHEHHKLIIKAEEMIRANDRNIEQIRSTRNWINGLSALQEMTDNADELVRCIVQQEKDGTSDPIGNFAASMQAHDDEKVMVFSVHHEHSADHEPNFQRQQSSEHKPSSHKRRSTRRNAYNRQPRHTNK